MKRVCLVIFMAALWFSNQVFASEIKIGALWDLSGATGADIAATNGVRDYIRYLNDGGGILGGQKIVLKEFDNQYQVPVALKGYEHLVRNEKVSLMFGFGTATSLAVSPKTNQDKVVYMGVSCHVKELADGEKNPYVFLVGITYDEELMLMAKHFMKSWKKDQKAKWQCFLPAAFHFVADRAKKYIVDDLNMEALPYIDVAAQDVDASTQMLQANKRNPDLMQTISGPKGIAAVLQARYKQRMTKIPSQSLSYGLDLDIIRMAGKSADGGITNSVTVLWGADAPSMKTMQEFNKKYSPDVAVQPVNYIRGWVTAMVFFEGIKRAGSLDGTKVKEALEGLKDFSTGGLTANISYSAANHKGLDGTYIYETVAEKKEFKKIGFESFQK